MDNTPSPGKEVIKMIASVVVLIVIIIPIALIIYAMDVHLEERWKLIKSRADLVLSLIIPFYLWFLVIKKKWEELE